MLHSAVYLHCCLTLLISSNRKGCRESASMTSLSHQATVYAHIRYFTAPHTFNHGTTASTWGPSAKQEQFMQLVEPLPHSYVNQVNQDVLFFSEHVLQGIQEWDQGRWARTAPTRLLAHGGGLRAAPSSPFAY